MKSIIEYVKLILQNEPTGHDFLHAMRVYHNAQTLMSNELDTAVVLASALVHDLIDPKLDSQFQSSKQEISNVLADASLSTSQITHVFDIIENMSFSKGTIPATMEGKIVQDADRLDALGAIGIARTFSYGGKHNRLIYHPETTNGTDSVSHFYQKLLLLHDLMNTAKGREEAVLRTEFMTEFLRQMNREIKGKG